MAMKSTLIIFMLLFVVCFNLSGQNLVREGNFEKGLGTWETNVVDEKDTLADLPTALAAFSAVSPGLGGSQKALFVEVIQPGKYDWYISATNRVALKTKNSFELSFRAKSDVIRKIEVGIYNDIDSGLPFFSRTIEISNEDKGYGPFKFYYEETPVKPGIKLFFGGAEGNLILDEIFLKTVPTVIEIETHNSIEDVIGDVTLPHEGLPHGVYDKYDWGKAPRAGAKNPPDHWTAAIAWGQVYEEANGNPAKNSRVQIRDLAMYYLSKTDGMWHELQSAVLVQGAAYVEDFVGDINKPADIRNEPDGSISVTAGDGYNFHFWPSTGRIQFPKGDVLGCFVTVNARLILDNPNGVDDRDSARYLMSVGGDWWESLTAVWDNWTTNWDMGIGRFRYVTKEWQGHNLITLSPEETLKNPPPLPKSTNINIRETVSGSDFETLNNYPNPFYDSTTIQYYLEKNSNATLGVYNVEGKHLLTLAEGFHPAGKHHVKFSGLDLKNGIYYYTLTTDNFTLTRKMILAK